MIGDLLAERRLWDLRSPKIVVGPPGPRVSELLKRSHIPGIYRHPLAEEAAGIWIRDPDGNIFMDFISGRCVVNVGHRHPRVVEALRMQLDHVTHGISEKRLRLEEELIKVTPGGFEKRVTYALSGSAANDSAIKLARWSTRRPYIVAFAGAYHGVTYGALSISSYLPRMVKGFGPNLPGVYHFPYPYCYRCPFGREHPDCDLACLRYMEEYAFKSYLPPEEVAAIIFEPIAGDAGWIVPPDGWLKVLKEFCERHDILLIAEEVQTGFGRTGKWFACEHWCIEPDIIVLGKAMAGGVPMSAVVARAELFERDNERFYHGHTFSGHPLGCAAALATLEVIKEEGLLENAEKVGNKIQNRLAGMMDDHEFVGDVRGRGLLIGVEVIKDKKSIRPGLKEADDICAAAFKRGLYIIRMGAFGTASLRVAPPLVITEDQADIGLDILEEALTEVEMNRQ
ncbi:MAG: aspartate aminotransferase family protein [Chloroflexi bacterium]|nr:MAG: aspartate aminotransferase family protein [Chloroflexota bacterium]